MVPVTRVLRHLLQINSKPTAVMSRSSGKIPEASREREPGPSRIRTQASQATRTTRANSTSETLLVVVAAAAARPARLVGRPARLVERPAPLVERLAPLVERLAPLVERSARVTGRPALPEVPTLLEHRTPLARSAPERENTALVRAAQGNLPPALTWVWALAEREVINLALMVPIALARVQPTRVLMATARPAWEIPGIKLLWCDGGACVMLFNLPS